MLFFYYNNINIYFSDIYGIAREKAKKAEVTSELTSDAGNDGNIRAKRKIFPKKFSSSDEDTEELTTIRMPPIIKSLYSVLNVL